MSRLTKEREAEIQHELEMENGHGPVKELLSEISALRAEVDALRKEAESPCADECVQDGIIAKLRAEVATCRERLESARE